MLDHEHVREQEALGIMGVNLIYGAFHYHKQPEVLIKSLMDGLTRERIELDMIKFSGPAFATLDNRLMSLQLVQQGLTDAAMFTADGEVVQPTDVLYKKPVLVERGSFRPVTNVTLDMLERAQEQFMTETGVKGEPAGGPHGDDVAQSVFRRRRGPQGFSSARGCVEFPGQDGADLQLRAVL